MNSKPVAFHYSHSQLPCGLQVLLLDDNLLLYLPPCLSLVSTLHVLHWRGNPLSFPPSQVLDQGWQAVKQFLYQMAATTGKAEHDSKTEETNIVKKGMKQGQNVL